MPAAALTPAHRACFVTHWPARGPLALIPRAPLARPARSPRWPPPPRPAHPHPHPRPRRRATPSATTTQPKRPGNGFGFFRDRSPRPDRPEDRFDDHFEPPDPQAPPQPRPPSAPASSDNHARTKPVEYTTRAADPVSRAASNGVPAEAPPASASSSSPALPHDWEPHDQSPLNSPRLHPSLSSSPYFATKRYTQLTKYNYVRPLTSLLCMVVGFTVFPFVKGVFGPLTLSENIDQLDVLITGTFTPVVGILFAMLASTAVSSLRQRQQDLRDLLNQELALIRMLLVMIKDASIIRLLLNYTLQLENETFAHRENGISYEHEKPGTDQAIRREEVFAESEETLWQCVQEANDLRLRSEVEATIRSLVVFRTKRRAVLDSGLPQIHFIITGLLGVCMVAAFCLVATADMRLFELTTARLLFGGLLSLLSLTYTLLRDLRDPFGGDYGVAPWRLYRTVELLRDRLGMPMS